ncbi:MAG: hypothetical protein HYY67_08170 [Thaumarchaeota archaeon]|nr:hypothetical protein [Nitrososphaerota archaeon]
MKSNPKIALTLFMVIVITGAVFGISAFTSRSETSGQKSDVAIEVKEPQVAPQPSPRPPPTPIIGKSISIDEAKTLAGNTGFAVRTPAHIPAKLKLVDIKAVGTAEISPGSKTIGVSEIGLVYSAESLSSSTGLSELLSSGGIMLIEQKRVPEAFEQLVDQLFEGKQENERGKIVSVKGKQGFYGFSSGILMWADETMQFEIVSSSTHYSLQDLMTIAESIP